MYPAGVIFDFDGVIVDTEPIHYRAFQKILVPLGFGYTWDEYIDKYIGFDDRDAFKEVFNSVGKLIDEKLLRELIQQKAVIFEQIVTNDVSPYPGVISLILELSEKKIPIAICSGALRSDIIPILTQLNIKDLFLHIITAEDVPISKPHPASYLKTKKLLIEKCPEKLDYKSFIYAIEDTPAGILSAKNAGLRVIAVTNSYQASKLAQADAIVTELTSLKNGNWP